MRVSWQRTEKDPQRPHEARSRDWSDAATSQGLSRVVRRLVSRTEGECVFLVRSRHIGSPLLRRPQETSASCTCIRSSMPTATPGGRIPTPAFQVRKGGLRAAERDPPVDVATNRTQRAIALLPPWKTIPNKGQRNIATEQDGRTDGRTDGKQPRHRGPLDSRPDCAALTVTNPAAPADMPLRVSHAARDVAPGLGRLCGTPHLPNYEDLERQGTQSRGTRGRHRRIC